MRPRPTDNEPAWSKFLAEELDGVAEYRCADGSRCDILTKTCVWEVEWAKKWKEAIGQAILYSALTNRPGGVILLTRKKPTETVYILRCTLACERAGLRIRFVQTV